MKKRNGFVSNSSSSSFICDVCGEDSSGWDMCLSESGMYECENGHTICEDACIGNRKSVEDYITEIGGQIPLLKLMCEKRIKEDELSVEENKTAKKDYSYYSYRIATNKEYLKRIIEEDEDLDDEVEEILENSFEIRYYLPSEVCPICRFDVQCDSDVSEYSLKKLNQTRNELKEELQKKFSSYDEFKKYLKS